MSEKDDICTLRGFLSARMKETWRRIREEEAKGKVIDFADFGRILHQVSDELRAERKKACPVRRW
jgi:hypothetical protein